MGIHKLYSLVMCLIPGLFLHARDIDVTRFGAKGDSTTLNTVSIQNAIEECNKTGGGRVIFPAGKYLSGTIVLRDNVTIQLQKNAVVLGSTNVDDYQNMDPFQDGLGTDVGWALIVAVDAKNIGIEGEGAIDGQGSKLKARQILTDTRPEGQRWGRRPFLLRIVRCEGVTVRGVTLYYSAAWTSHYFQSKKIRIEGLKIISRGVAHNDGIDIDGCQDVNIRDCDINSGDDALCFKTTSSEMACRDIVVTAMRLKSSQGAIKMGTESMAAFENIKISDCYIYQTNNGGIKLLAVDGAHLRNVEISGINMVEVKTPILIRLGSRLSVFRKGKDVQQQTGSLENVVIKNVRAKAADSSQLTSPTGILITGVPGHPIQNLRLENIEIDLSGGGTKEQARTAVPEAIDKYPEVKTFGPSIPAYGVWARHVDGLKLINIRFNLKGNDLRPAIICEDGRNIEITSCKIPATSGAESILRLENAKSVVITNNEVKGNADCFVRIEGAGSEAIHIGKGQSKQIKKIIDSGPEVNAGTVGLLSIAAYSQTGKEPKAKSQWVFADANGRLVYKTTASGDRIMDFSFAGYMGGGVAIPSPPAKIILGPVEGDNTAQIQKAIDDLAQLPMENGSRGAVLLRPGIYNCAETIHINSSGIVLRGSGGDAGGTIINMTGQPHNGISVKGLVNYKTTGDTAFITDSYVPSGSFSFTVDDGTKFHVGDSIRIRHPVTEAWVAFMGMDKLVREGKKQTWVNGDIFTDRVIRNLDKNSITVDVPLTDSYDSKYLRPPGADVIKIVSRGMISQVGLENLRIVSPEQSVTINEKHHQAFSMSGVTNAWAKNIEILNTVNSISITGNRITIDHVNIMHTVPTIGAAKPADLNGSGSQLLFNQCSITGDNLFFFGTGAKVTGPVVLLHCVFKGNGWIQPHQRWATGLLIDECEVPDGGIDFMNRGEMGSGHGWAIGWAVAWNCKARSYLNQQPPGAFNWVIGSKGEKKQGPMPFEKDPLLPEGSYDSHGIPVWPASLYLAQLSERLNRQAIINTGY